MVEEQSIEPAAREILRFLFGDAAENKAHQVYARYAMGDPVSVIAADLKISPSEVYRRMRKIPDQYEETKKMREAFLGLRLRRSLSLIDAHNLKLLEGITEGTLTLTGDQMKDLTRWAKDVAHRLQLHEGKATEITGTDEKLTREQVKAILKEQEDAGDGLCTEF
jgi:hypothetical protein